MSNVSAVTNHFPTANEGFITTLGGSILASAATVPLTSVSGLTNGTIFVGIIEPGQAKQQTFTGVVDTAGVQITGVKWTRGTNVDHTAGVTIVDYVSGTGNNMITKGILEHANQDGTLITQAVRDALALGTSSTTGWEVGSLPNVTSIVANGNRSYTLTHASSIASIITPGFRRRFTRTVAANTYMGGLMNGSSHYFTKTSPSGTLGTVTNNFTIEAVVQPTSYQNGTIAARADAAGNNAITLKINASGQVECAVQNGGAANYRIVATYQSLPLNKKTHVAASWTGGTVVTYFDGVSVPVGAATTGGTAPTTAGTGGDFSIGRKGASSSEYAPGYISNVAVFDAVLTPTVIKQHATIKLLGNEPNCIGAWSLDNTANDQSSAANHLTAQGGVGFTAGMSPFGNNGVSSTLEYGLTMSVSADGLTEVVQCPEGCALPTTGGISASAYSTMANPFGWVGDKGRWAVQAWNNLGAPASGSIAGTWSNIPGLQIYVPVGTWKLNSTCTVTGNSSTAALYILQVQWDYQSPAFGRRNQFVARAQTAINYNMFTSYHNDDLNITTGQTWLPYAAMVNGAGTQTAYLETGKISMVEVVPSGL